MSKRNVDRPGHARVVSERPDRDRVASSVSRQNRSIRHEGLVRRRRMTYQLNSVRDCQVTLSTAREDHDSPCPHHSSVNCLASGKAGSLITACTAMTSIVSPCSRKPSATPGLHLENDLARLGVLVGDAAPSTSDRSLVPGRPGRRRPDRPARTSRLRAAASRGVVGRKPAVLASLSQADARAPGRPPPRAAQARSFPPGLTHVATGGDLLRADQDRGVCGASLRPQASRTPPECRPRRNSGGRPAGGRSAPARRGSRRYSSGAGGEQRPVGSVTSIRSSRTGVSPISSAERAGVGLVDIDAADADVHQHHAIAPRQGVPAGGGHHLGDRRPAASGTSRARLSVGRGPQADRQPKSPALAGEAIDLGDQADGADRDRPGRDRPAVRTAQQVGGRQHRGRNSRMARPSP